MNQLLLFHELHGMALQLQANLVNISCNYTSRTYNTTTTDSYSSAYGDLSCNPAVVANSNWFGVFFIGRSAVLLYILISVLPTKRMYGRKKRNVRTKKNIFANCHRATVNTSKIEICLSIQLTFLIFKALRTSNRELVCIFPCFCPYG